MIKNVIALILVVLLMTFMFVGCKKPDDVYYVPSDLTSSNKDTESERTENETETEIESQPSQEDNFIEIPSSWQTGGDEDKSDSSSKKQNSGTSSKKPTSNTTNKTPTNPNDMVVSRDDDGYDPWHGIQQ